MERSNDTVYGWDGITIFELEAKEYGIRIKDLHAVIRPGTFELNYENDMGGLPVMKIEDLYIPVFDIHSILGLKKKLSTSKSRIIIVDPDDLVFGFEADSVVEMMTFNPGQEMPEFRKNDSNSLPFTAGSLLIGKREIILPDLEKIAANISAICGSCHAENEN